MAAILTKLGMMDEVLLQCLDTVDENDDCKVSMREYCLLGCPGKAHATGKPDADGHFCNQHVARSVHVQVKRYPGVAAEQGAFA